MKIGLIISHEYTTRVMKKSFLLITFITPILMIALMAVPAWIATLKSDSQKSIVIIDKSGLYSNKFADNDEYHFIIADDEVSVARKQHPNVTGYLYISDDLTKKDAKLIFYSEKQAGASTISYLERQINNAVQDQKIAATGIADFKELLKSTRSDLNILSVKWSDDGDSTKTSSAELAEIVGLFAGLLIYMFIVIYGAQVMSGVVQEKSNRIMEVMLSSVKPFELMLGKIIGIACVGLTQFFIWVVLLIAGAAVVLPAFGLSAQTAQTEALQVAQDTNFASQMLQSALNFNWGEIIILFVVYFLGGYLLYASLFAALGSAVDNETDTQQFSLPITLPIIFAMYAGLYSAENPEGAFAFWCSMIPFTSPVVMLIRLPFDVAWWEILTSVIILILSFIGSTWLAGKIYRTGVFMYGKKPTLKEIIKWISY